jgi:16S rRNA (adenine1518-N6/adenine1519-N6)-dimethyltransferase
MGNNPASLPSLSETIRRHGLLARKSLGQHFLLDGNITEKIVRTAGDLNALHVIEIGPGPGGLTRALLNSKAAHIYAIEKDHRCAGALAELAETAEGRLSVLMQDALETALTEQVPAPRAIVANLPYNVGTLLLIHWLHDIAHMGADAYRSLTLMFQKEVAMRLVAKPHSKDYGRLSVLTQWLCDVDHAFDLPPGAFTPPPKVSSSVLKLTPLSAPRYPIPLPALEATLKAAFGQRRKMLRSSLQSLADGAEAWLRATGIDPTRRAETLSVEEFCALARGLPRNIG